MQPAVIFHRRLYWDAAPALCNRVILYMVFLLNISKTGRGGGGGGGVMCSLPFFFFFLSFFQELRLVMLAAAWLL